MPQPDGTLTDEEVDLVTKRLAEIWKESPHGKGLCPICGTDTFYLHPALIANRSDTLSVLSPHTRLPCVVLYCSKCGHATHYVATVLGLTPVKAEDENG